MCDLELAYNKEKAALSLYEKLSSENPIFTAICEIRKKGCELLQNYADIKNIELKSKKANISVPKSLQAQLICALNNEMQICEFYEELCQKCDDEVLKDLFFRLWATSNNEYIKALNIQLQSIINEQSTSANKAQTSIKENSEQNSLNALFSSLDISKDKGLNDFIDKIKNLSQNKISQDDLKQIIQNPHFAFLAGTAAGGLLCMSINAFINKTNQKESK